MPCQPRLVHARNRGVRGSGPPGFRREADAMCLGRGGPLRVRGGNRARSGARPARPDPPARALVAAPGPTRSTGGVYTTILARSPRVVVPCTYAVVHAARPHDRGAI